jgi:site-specific DNA-cytosine methylase
VEQQYRQLGNVVAPVAAELVARRIQTASGV